MNRDLIVDHLKQQLDGLLGIYAFGSQISGHATAQSDLDLAVLVAGYADPVQLWQIASELSELICIEVDLLDLRAASTVMQYQVITTGQRWWEKDTQAALYETFILSEKTNLDEARAALVHEIHEQGKVYGR